MKNIVFITIPILFVGLSCGKKTPEPVNDIPLNFKFYYVDSAGDALFSQANDGKNGYWMDSVVIFDDKNGTKSQVDSGYPAFGDSYNFANYAQYGYYLNAEVMIVYGNNDIVNHYSNTIIQLKPGVLDTLKVHFTSDFDNYGYDDSVWYNGHLQLGKDTIMTIIK